MSLYTKILIILLLAGILMANGCVKTPLEQPFVGEELTEPSTSGIGVPTTDVAGKDFSDIPRYTGSTRIFYGKDAPTEGFTISAYITTASLDEVLDFYNTQFPANGWTIIDSGEISKMPTAEKEGRGMAIVTITDSEDYPGYTDVNILVG